MWLTEKIVDWVAGLRLAFPGNPVLGATESTVIALPPGTERELKENVTG